MFLFAAPLSYRCGAGLVPVRKPGKLPWESITKQYDLEYGTDELEMHVDAFGEGDRVLIVDDVLATGGTAAATVDLVESTGASVAGLGFVVELGFLRGGAKLEHHEVFSLLVYD